MAGESLFGQFVRAVRDKGRWRGVVYALTDRPECAPPKVEVVPVEVAPNCERTAGSMLYKQLKMLLLEVVAARGREEFMLYLDVDVIVGRPLAPFIAAAVDALRRDESATLAAYEEAAVTLDAPHAERLLLEPYHGGVLMARAGRSERCLAVWLRKVVAAIDFMLSQDPDDATFKRSHVRDQPLLGESVRERACVISPLPPETLCKPTPEQIQSQRYAVLNHLSRSSRLRRTRNSHNISAQHLEMLGTDLVGVKKGQARFAWWKQPARCNATVEQQRASSAKPLLIGCHDEVLRSSGGGASTVIDSVTHPA